MRTIFPAIFIFFLAFMACDDRSSQHKEESAKAEDQRYLENGISITSSVFQVLSRHLTDAMSQGGVRAAVQYCNLAAFPLVDSLSNAHNATIRRTSHKLRNPGNAPNDEETGVINEFLAAKSNNLTLSPLVKKSETEVHFFAPIILAEACLKCHGEIGKDISVKDYAIIDSLYSDDNAIDFKTGDLRGIWSVSFKQ